MKNNIYETLQNGYNKDLWYDWFCKEDKLETRGKALLAKLSTIALSKKFNITETKVEFKNNCPYFGKIYDDFRIVDNDGVMFCVTPKSGHTNMEGKGEIYGRVNNFAEPLFVGTWKEIVDWFMK